MGSFISASRSLSAVAAVAARLARWYRKSSGSRHTASKQIDLPPHAGKRILAGTRCSNRLLGICPIALPALKKAITLRDG